MSRRFKLQVRAQELVTRARYLDDKLGENNFLHDPQYQFEWDSQKAASNLRKHGASFDLARTVFSDPLLLTVPDLEHSEAEERWFSIGPAATGSILSLVYLWSQAELAVTKVRIISARKSTSNEIRQYEERVWTK
jgi:uncharacterized protein